MQKLVIAALAALLVHLATPGAQAWNYVLSGGQVALVDESEKEKNEDSLLSAPEAVLNRLGSVFAFVYFDKGDNLWDICREVRQTWGFRDGRAKLPQALRKQLESCFGDAVGWLAQRRGVSRAAAERFAKRIPVGYVLRVPPGADKVAEVLRVSQTELVAEVQQLRDKNVELQTKLASTEAQRGEAQAQANSLRDRLADLADSWKERVLDMFGQLEKGQARLERKVDGLATSVASIGERLEQRSEKEATPPPPPAPEGGSITPPPPPALPDQPIQTASADQRGAQAATTQPAPLPGGGERGWLYALSALVAVAVWVWWQRRRSRAERRADFAALGRVLDEGISRRRSSGT